MREQNQRVHVVAWRKQHVGLQAVDRLRQRPDGAKQPNSAVRGRTTRRTDDFDSRIESVVEHSLPTEQCQAYPIAAPRETIGQMQRHAFDSAAAELVKSDQDVRPVGHLSSCS
jgi:hypothetical protein